MRVVAVLVLLVAAVLAALPARPQRRRLRGLAATPDDASRSRPARWRHDLRQRWSRASPRAALLCAASMAAAGCGLAGGPVAALAGGLYGGAGTRAVLRHRETKARRRAEQAALDAVSGLADDLRAGRTPEQALSAAVEAITPEVDEPARRSLRAVLGAAASTDLAAAFRDVRHPGLGAVFRRLAAVWRLSDAGVPLAELLDSLEAELRAHRRAADRAAAQLASARATARLLAGLPLVGLVLGFALGVDPLGIVLHTVPGGGCAVLAMVLQLAGTAWTERLGRAVVSP